MKLFPLFLIILFYPAVVYGVSSAPSGTIFLKGEDFPVEQKAELACVDSGTCIQFNEEIRKTIRIVLSAPLGEQTLRLEIEVPATIGAHKLKLDKDGDPRPGEKFQLEIYGSNAPVDKVVYTLEDIGDDAMVNITDISEEQRSLNATFSGKFFDAATGVKRAQVNGTILINGY
ncbi:MAG TPA: hypothetical protein PLU53_07780 [Bacteroidia bacterium]|nr:hypothetical protein [Bacteroidia bacterium]